MSTQEWTKTQVTFVQELRRSGALRPSCTPPDTQDPSRTPYTVELSRLRSFPPAVDFAVWSIKDVLRHLSFDAVADLSPDITPVVSVLSHRCRTPMISPRAPANGHSSLPIAGVVANGKTVLVLEGALQTGEHALAGIRLIEAANLRVRDVITLLDTEEGGREFLTNAGYIVHPVLTLSSLLPVYESAA